MNDGSIPIERSHGLIQYFPLIVRVNTLVNVNKMLTGKNIGATTVNFRFMRSQCAAGTRKIGNLGVAHSLHR